MRDPVCGIAVIIEFRIIQFAQLRAGRIDIAVRRQQELDPVGNAFIDVGRTLEFDMGTDIEGRDFGKRQHDSSQHSRHEYQTQRCD